MLDLGNKNPLRHLVIAHVPFRKTVVTIACFPILHGSYLKQGVSYSGVRFSCSAHYGKDCYECLTDVLLVKALKEGKLIP